MSNPQLLLYSTAHCSACEQALDLLFGHRAVAGLQLQVVEVADDDELLARYGEHVPVLRVAIGRRRDGAGELRWPFTADDIDAALASAVDD
ncbi:MAG: glutaredoxin family protein [Pseudomonadota bacterium]